MLNCIFRAPKSELIFAISDLRTLGFFDASALAEMESSVICLVTLTDSSFCWIVFFAFSIVSILVLINVALTAARTFLLLQMSQSDHCKKKRYGKTVHQSSTFQIYYVIAHAFDNC